MGPRSSLFEQKFFFVQSYKSLFLLGILALPSKIRRSARSHVSFVRETPQTVFYPLPIRFFIPHRGPGRG